MLENYGYTGGPEGIPEGMLLGRVIEEQRGRYRAVTERGEIDVAVTGAWMHGAAHRDEYPAVGDFVLVRHNPGGPSMLTELLPRHSKFSRVNLAGHAEGYAKHALEQVVVTNFDYVFILSSLNHDFSVQRIARYLTLALQGGGQPVVILTKADLCEDATERIRQAQAVACAVPVIAVSSYTGQGLEQLAPYLQPEKTIVFLGMSGVGKSSLLNTLYGAAVMPVKEIREDDSRGRHTTTHRQLICLPSGALVIDTPGMRELGLFDAAEGVSEAFEDVEALFGSCRFVDCTHQSEPDCAIRGAIQEGMLPQERWMLYQAQRKELAFLDNKTAYLRQKQGRHKEIAMHNRKLDKARR